MKRILAALIALAMISGLTGYAAEPKPAPPAPVVNPATVEVWTTRTGKRYHRATCRHAKIQSNLKDAQARGLTPCQVCKP